MGANWKGRISRVPTYLGARWFRLVCPSKEGEGGRGEGEVDSTFKVAQIRKGEFPKFSLIWGRGGFVWFGSLSPSKMKRFISLIYAPSSFPLDS